MITIRKSKDRGHIDHGWLNARHTFSFGDYRDREHMSFRSLRVINEDVVAPRTGFPEHPHHDMEIITYPISGALRHGDSLGHQEDIAHGTIQTMTAGSGIRHAESNPHAEPVHLLQIWILPRARGLEPSHASRSFPIAEQPGRFHQIVSPDGADNSLVIQQDARMHAGIFSKGHAETVALGPGRHAWIQVVRGSLSVNATELSAGDGAAISDESTLELIFTDDSEVLLFDLN
ncbi:MAG: pirin family protein [Phycisphaerales bacterium]|nr:pirin family protein [Planctomycetota bacterium]MCH8509333.1 pirin family protein [Phycisphaerales bacterium]